MRGDKKALILETIILEYIRRPLPIGSEHLREQSLSMISSATIRKYFKELLDEGYLVQYHASGGRVPADRTLSGYWHRTLAQIGPLRVPGISRIEQMCDAYGISAIVHEGSDNVLRDVVSADNGYVVLVFDDGEAVLPYDAMIFAFLRQFIGHPCETIVHVGGQYGVPGLDVLAQRLGRETALYTFMGEGFFRMAGDHPVWGSDVIGGWIGRREAQSIAEGTHTGGIVPEGALLFKQEARIGDRRGWVICLGHLSQNFLGFLHDITQGEAA